MFLAALSRYGSVQSSKNVLFRYFSSKVDFNKLVHEDKVVVFLKGEPSLPRCGFSNAVVQILRIHGVKYKSHDVLQDWDIREGIKKYSNWPTIPQVFINGEFIGGSDILTQMHRNGDLIKELEKVGIKSALLEKLEKQKSGEAQKKQ